MDSIPEWEPRALSFNKLAMWSWGYCCDSLYYLREFLVHLFQILGFVTSTMSHGLEPSLHLVHEPAIIEEGQRPTGLPAVLDASTWSLPLQEHWPNQPAPFRTRLKCHLPNKVSIAPHPSFTLHCAQLLIPFQNKYYLCINKVSVESRKWVVLPLVQ